MSKTLANALLLVLLSTSSFAQSLTSLAGGVADPTGAAVPDTSILVTNADNNQQRETKSDEGVLKTV